MATPTGNDSKEISSTAVDPLKSLEVKTRMAKQIKTLKVNADQGNALSAKLLLTREKRTYI